MFVGKWMDLYLGGLKLAGGGGFKVAFYSINPGL